jgi:aquaporin Z
VPAGRVAVSASAADEPEPRSPQRALLALEFPGLLDFDDPALEWRRLFSELFGTFLLVLVGAGAGVVNALSHGAISRSTAVAAPGLIVASVILFMGAVSGATSQPGRHPRVRPPP